MPGEPRRRKYGNQPVEVDGIRFDSKREAARWGILRLMEQAGEIRDLQRQVRFPLEVNGVKVTTYVADFTYRDPKLPLERGSFVVEDAKGCRTREYLLKRKLMKAIHGVEVKET